MCGICGIISNEIIDFNDIKKMNDSIIHRGPDGEGYLITSNVLNPDNSLKIDVINNDISISLAHRRLSIIDLTEAGHQPMSYLNKYWLTYNGEVYNYLELRNELIELGYTFKSSTDTEVIIAAFDYWGVDCFKKFNGMWAMALLDLSTNKLIISRDRLGQKPFYYYKSNTDFIFGSEIKTILNHPKYNFEVNSEYISEFYEKGSLEFKRETAFQNIYRLEPSVYAEIHLNRLNEKIEFHKYWTLQINTSKEKYSHEKAVQYSRQYYDILYDAVKLRLRADVSIGSAFSGGLDSSSIVYIINQILKQKGVESNQLVFSTVHDEAGTEYCDETEFIDQVAKQLNLESKKIAPRSFEIPMIQKDVITAWECPCDGLSAGGMYTFKLIKENAVTVTLDGQGADEQLAGYQHYITNHVYTINLIEALRETWAFRYEKVFFMSALKGMLMKVLPNVVIKKILKKDSKIFKSSVNEVLYLDTFKGLNNLIHYADARSMHYSIESRMPFLDYRLVEFLATVPSVYKIRRGWTKYLSRLAFDGKLPDQVVWRKDKMGWAIPSKFWLDGPLKQWYFSTIRQSKEQLINLIGVDNYNDNSELTKKIRKLNLSLWLQEFKRYNQ